MMNKKKPVSIVIFGATGNLAITKIIPSIAKLFNKNELPINSRLVGVSRREWNDDAFRNFLKNNIDSSKLTNNIFHSEVEFDEGRGYYDLYDKLRILDNKFGKTDWIFYLSLAPKFYERVMGDIKKAGLLTQPSTKILIEKPFGSDEKSAKKLNSFITSFLKHEQIYRVDHYLGKGAIRAIMSVHEKSNSLSKILNRETVGSIRIKLLETKGVEKRGASYDGVGAFRDVGQNHILEMLAVLLVTPLHTKNATAWHKARAEVLEALLPPAKTCEFSRRGQYKGYIKEWAIPDKSKTETAFEVVTSLASGKLKGVPIIFEAGKMMAKSEASITVEFKIGKSLLKKIYIKVQPKPVIKLCYYDKVQETIIGDSGDAYENVIKDTLAGERRHFVGSREIIASWRYADRVVGCWNKVPLEIYSKNKPFII